MIITPIRTAEYAGFAPLPGTAVIRIYDPSEEWRADAAQQRDAGWGAFLPLAFWDLGEADMGLLERLLVRLLGASRDACLAAGQRLFGIDEIPWRPFLTADAVEVAHFADGLAQAGITHLMVVCRNGKGRSGTISRWLSKRTGATLATHGADQGDSEFIRETLEKAA